VHGGKPVEVYDLIMKGVLTKGMPTWGPVLGARKVSEVTAYILSKHKEGEPILLEQAAGVASQ
jgi:cytochrome c oxidase cbb3-type subunit 3